MLLKSNVYSSKINIGRAQHQAAPVQDLQVLPLTSGQVSPSSFFLPFLLKYIFPVEKQTNKQKTHKNTEQHNEHCSFVLTQAIISSSSEILLIHTKQA